MKNFAGYNKGVNLGGWLSQCVHTKEHYDTFIQKEDIAKIASWSMDHVRLPIDYNLMEEEAGGYIDWGFDYIDNAISWCEEYNLNLVLDLHKAAGYSFDAGECESGFFENEELQERFYRLWEEIAKRYGRYSDRVCFELLNEVTNKEYCDTWNKIIKKCISRIRNYAQETIILVGGYWNNSPEAVKDLDAPYDDKIVYNFHCYEPIKFTHQGATWTDLVLPDERFVFEAFDINESYFMNLFTSAYEAAEKNGTVLYCGEYGVIDRVAPKDTLKWFKAIHAAFEKMGINHCAWSYKKMDFGLSDERLSGVIDELLQNL